MAIAATIEVGAKLKILATIREPIWVVSLTGGSSTTEENGLNGGGGGEKKANKT